jgi:hypothetical protein
MKFRTRGHPHEEEPEPEPEAETGREVEPSPHLEDPEPFHPTAAMEFAPADSPEQLAYTPPAITASGTTFAQWQTFGLVGHLEKLIAANTFTANQVIGLRYAETGKLQIVFDNARNLIEGYLRGEPMDNATAAQKLLDRAVMFSALATLMNEAGTLMAANQGTLSAMVKNPAQHQYLHRTFP